MEAKYSAHSRLSRGERHNRTRNKPLLIRQQVGLVQQQHVFLVWIYFCNIPLQIGTAEEKGIAGVDNLHDNIATWGE